MKKTGNPAAFFEAICRFLRSIFQHFNSLPDRKPRRVLRPADNRTEPVRILDQRVMVIVYDPAMGGPGGKKLSQKEKWHNVDELISGFISDVLETSFNLLRYHVVERIEINEFPPKIDGYRYNATSYSSVLQGAKAHQPEMADYHSILTNFNILQRISTLEIDEVWIFAFPNAGFYESIMAGKEAFWCNAPPLKGTAACNRRFIIMGFSYERGIGEMLEAFGHRAESILGKTWEHTHGDANLYQRYSRYDLSRPGQAEVGSIHFAPNSRKDYDWSNTSCVPSKCGDWLNFPDFQGTIDQVTAAEWGKGDMRLHHKWWLSHLPHTTGRTGGVANNWWQYIADPNLSNL